MTFGNLIGVFLGGLRDGWEAASERTPSAPEEPSYVVSAAQVDAINKANADTMLLFQRMEELAHRRTRMLRAGVNLIAAVEHADQALVPDEVIDATRTFRALVEENA